MDEPEDHTQDTPDVTTDGDVDPGLLEETWDEPDADPADDADADDVVAVDVLADEDSAEGSEDVAEDLDETVPDELTVEDALADDADGADVEVADDLEITEPVEESVEESIEDEELTDVLPDEDSDDGPVLPEVEPTGHPAVDAVLERLDGLRETSVHEHVAVFEEAHAALRRALDESGPQG